MAKKYVWKDNRMKGSHGITQEDAVLKAIEELGDQTSLKVLQTNAQLVYGATINISVVCSARLVWRKKNDVERDNRTYEGQPRRNMLNDERIELPQVKRIQQFIKKGGNIVALQNLIKDGPGAFHSLQQLTGALSELKDLQIKIAS